VSNRRTSTELFNFSNVVNSIDIQEGWQGFFGAAFRGQPTKSDFENAVADRLPSWQSSSMSPIMTINSLTPVEIRQEVKEMQDFRKKLEASPAKAKKFFKSVRLACGEGVPVKKAKR